MPEIRFSLLIWAIFLCLILHTTTHAQGVSYSDSWMVANSTSVTSVGCGVTDESYSNYAHVYSLTTTMTSPDGRTTIGYGSNGSCGTGSTQCARADVSLPVIVNDVFEGGDYFVETVHEIECPYSNMGYMNTYTSGLVRIGASISVLTKAAMSNIYTKIVNCNVRCPVDQYIADEDYGQYIQGIVPYSWSIFTGYLCANFSLFYRADSTTQCRDIEGPVPFTLGGRLP